MRWDNLFDDLESQLEHELTAEEVDLHAEEERLRLARLGLRDRLLSLHRADSTAAASTAAVRLVLSDGSRISVAPRNFGRDWLAGELRDGGSRTTECIVPLDAISALVLSRDDITGSLDSGSQPESSHSLSARLGLAFVLRDLCRRRQPIELKLADGATLHGTLDRVGRDHCDLAVHDVGEARRESAVFEYRLVRLNQILLVRL